MIHHALHESTDGTVTFRDVPYKIRFGQKSAANLSASSLDPIIKNDCFSP